MRRVSLAAFNFLQACSWSIVAIVRANFVYQMTSSNVPVGALLLCQAFSHSLALFGVQRWVPQNRKFLLIAVLLSILATVVTLAFVWLPFQLWIGALSAALCGTVDGMLEPQQPEVLSRAVGSMVGPLVAMLVFAQIDNSWSSGTLQFVWTIGVSLLFLAYPCLCYMLHRQLNEVPLLSSDPPKEESFVREETACHDRLLFACHLGVSFAAGVTTTSYFLLFFARELDPMIVAAMMAQVGPAMMLMTNLGQRASRLQVTLSFFALCVSSLALGVLSFQDSWPLILVLFVIHTVSLSFTRAALRRKNPKMLAKLATGIGALVGGILSDNTSYSTTFLYAAEAQCCLVFLLLRFVPAELERWTRRRDATEHHLFN